MKPVFFGEPSARYMFLQPVDGHDLELMEREAAALRELSGCEGWCIAALPVEDWFRDLTPWEAAPVFGRQPFGEGAARTLRELTDTVIPGIEASCPAAERDFLLGGYSLAGFFSLWAAYQTDRFAGIAAVSPSVWYPGWIAYAEEHGIHIPRVYLSLGDREEKARNPVMATVGDAIRTQHRLLSESGISCRLDWNPGNHFADSDRRTARGFAWLLAVLRAENEES